MYHTVLSALAQVSRSHSSSSAQRAEFPIPNVTCQFASQSSSVLSCASSPAQKVEGGRGRRDDRWRDGSELGESQQFLIDPLQRCLEAAFGRGADLQPGQLLSEHLCQENGICLGRKTRADPAPALLSLRKREGFCSAWC